MTIYHDVIIGFIPRCDSCSALKRAVSLNVWFAESALPKLDLKALDLAKGGS